MRAYAIGWTRGGPLLIRDIGGEWGRADDPTLVPRIYEAEQFAKNGIRANAQHGKLGPMGTANWSDCLAVELDIRPVKLPLFKRWLAAF